MAHQYEVNRYLFIFNILARDVVNLVPVPETQFVRLGHMNEFIERQRGGGANEGADV